MGPPTLLDVGDGGAHPSAGLPPAGWAVTREAGLPSVARLPPFSAAVLRGAVSPAVLSFLKDLSSAQPTCFTVVFHPSAAEDALIRFQVFQHGGRMVTQCQAQLQQCLEFIAEQLRTAGPLECPFCGLAGLTAAHLWRHTALYHANDKPRGGRCPICREPVQRGTLQVHIHDQHPPTGPPEPSRRGMPLYAFGLVVVRRPTDGKFLLVQEYAGQGYWLPGGHMEAGEDPATAAVRETKEEAGVDVELKGVLRVEFSVCPGPYGRLRLIYYAEPTDPMQLPKSLPDFESCGAVYVAAEEVERLPLRSAEPRHWLPYVARGGPIFPLSVFTPETAPVLAP